MKDGFKASLSENYDKSSHICVKSVADLNDLIFFPLQLAYIKLRSTKN